MKNSARATGRKLAGLYHPAGMPAIAEPRKTLKSRVIAAQAIAIADAGERGPGHEKPVHGWQTL
jgi:hypothetical protein